MPDEPSPKRSRRSRPGKPHSTDKTRSPKSAAEPHFLSREELRSARPIPATQPPPAELAGSPEPELYVQTESAGKPQVTVAAVKPAGGERDGLWRVHVHSSSGTLGAVLPGRSQESLDAKELGRPGRDTRGTEGFRPPWLDLTFLPQTLPHRLTFEVPEALRQLSPLLPPVFHVERAEQLNTGYPWSTIGKVDVIDPRNPSARHPVGSGVLVGPNLMLTASHVAPWGKSPWSMKFTPALRDSTAPFGSSFVQTFRGVQDFNGHPGLDYVICKLFTRLGDRVGWMGTQCFGNQDKYKDFAWVSVGYPTDSFNGKRPVVEPFVPVADVDSDADGVELETHTFATAGWSGGPLWSFLASNDPRVVGTMVGEEEEL